MAGIRDYDDINTNLRYWFDRLFDHAEQRRPGQVVFFDIGANTGVFTRSYAHRCNAIYAFEPNPAPAAALAAWATENAADRVQVLHFGLTGRPPAARQESARQESGGEARQESARQESGGEARQESARRESARRESGGEARQESARQESAPKESGRDAVATTTLVLHQYSDDSFNSLYLRPESELQHYNLRYLGPRSIELRTLDALSLPDPAIIKIDVEGAEQAVLWGGEQTIRRSRPGMIVEYSVDNTSNAGYDRRRILEFLLDCGYDVGGLYRNIETDLRYGAELDDRRIWNLVAIPR